MPASPPAFARASVSAGLDEQPVERRELARLASTDSPGDVKRAGGSRASPSNVERPTLNVQRRTEFVHAVHVDCRASITPAGVPARCHAFGPRLTRSRRGLLSTAATAAREQPLPLARLKSSRCRGRAQRGKGDLPGRRCEEIAPYSSSALPGRCASDPPGREGESCSTAPVSGAQRSSR